MNSTFLKNIGEELIILISPLKVAFTDVSTFQAFLRRLGWSVEIIPDAELSDINIKITDLFNYVNSLGSDKSDDDYLQLFIKIKETYESINNTIDGVADALLSDPILNDSFKNELPYRLFELLLNDYLVIRQPNATNLLTFFNFIEKDYVPKTSDRLSYVRNKINWPQLLDIVRNPISLIKSNFLWNNTEDLLFEKLALYISSFLGSKYIPAFYKNVDIEDAHDINVAFGTSLLINKKIEVHLFSIITSGGYIDFLVNLYHVQGLDVADSGFVLSIDIPNGVSLAFDINDNLTLKLDLSAAIGDSLAFLITPNKIDFKLVGNPTMALPPLGLNVRLEYNPDEAKMIFGKQDGTKLVLKNAGIGIGAKYVASELELLAEADLSGLVFTLDTGDGDSFINSVLGKGKKAINLPLAIQWSSKHGITFKGVGAFEIAFNPNIDIADGKVKVNGLSLALRAPKGSDTVSAEVRASFSGDLGFMKFVVDEIGLRFNIKTNEGNLGPIGIGLGFAPPKGIGLSVEVKGLSGGGFLSIDAEKGRYVGALQLSLVDKFDLTALAIITTKAPDGSKGFTLLAMVNVEFQPTIQLGLGFSLSGLGGLLAVNRRMSAEALRLGVKSGAIDRILFPDPEKFIENVPTIVKDLEGIFPTQKDRYVIGLFCLINWGVSDEFKVLDIKLGILAEFPSPIKLAIIGTLGMKLPENEPTITLKVAFAGFIDLEKKYLSFDASIYDSKIMTYSLSGDMAVRLFWGDRSELLLSVGGFHPSYTPPSFLLLPAKMERMTILLFDTKELSLKMMNYFAVTSNTAQFGARIEFLLNVKVFKVIGLLGLDVLFQFNPFKLIAQIEAMLAVFSGKRELLSVAVKANLEGPGPWHAWGTGEFRVLGMTASANFDENWGPAPKTTLPEISVEPLVRAALTENSAWRTVISDKKKEVVSLKKLENVFILHPSGQLIIGQKIAPLGIKLSRYGTQKISDSGLYNISEVKIADEVQITQSELEQFAPANYREMNDDQKLKSASFEYLRSGVRVNTPANIDFYMVIM